MKIVVISDSHGNIENLKHVLGFAKKIKAEAIIHCGDWNTVPAIEVVLGSGLPVYGVLGNADIDPKLAEKLSEKLLEVEIDGRKIGVVHNIRHLTSSIEHFDILFHGHTHQQKESVIDRTRVVNPGALAKDVSFAVYDTEANKVELITI